MSLLITSSKQPRVGGTIDIGIERPFNYINNFQNPVKIPKNSEIAVESVKINRQPRIQAKDKTILGWFGRRFHQTSGSSVSETSEYVIANVLALILTHYWYKYLYAKKINTVKNLLKDLELFKLGS